MATDQGYGIKCEPDMSFQAEYFHPPQNFGQDPTKEVPISPDMDLSSFLEMDLSELTNGSNATEWNSLFNGQLDGLDTLDPSTGMQSDPSAMNPGAVMATTNGGQVDRWLLEETHKLERQQKIQQQKLLELQQTLLKTEILKNQLQIASISHSTSSPPASISTSSPSPPLFGTLPGSGGNGNFNFSPSVSSSLATSSPLSQRLPQVKNPVSYSTSSQPLRSPSLSSPISSPPLLLPVQPSTPTMSCMDDEGPIYEGDKRKVHNLIEKKYRCSINDRIGLLREMVSKHTKDSKRLQKSAVLQKTIDYIRHLENNVRRLQEENRSLKNTLAKVTGGSRLPSLSSPPDTPHQSISPPYSSESGDDSGHPSSPDDYPEDYMQSRESSPQTSVHHGGMSLLASHLTARSSSSVFMCVMLVAVFFINPMTFIGGSHHSGYYTGGSMRSLSGVDGPGGAGHHGDYFLLNLFFWALRILIAAVCFGWMTFKSMPGIRANPDAGNRFWKFYTQAREDLDKGEFVDARDNLEAALAVIGRPTPTSYYGIITGLVWSIFSHLLFQLVVGRLAVSLASVLIRNPDAHGYGGRKKEFGVTFSNVAETYHLLHQINMACSGGLNLHGMGFYLALNALNFAEADRPFHLLSEQQLSEMFFLLGLQCHFSIRVPYASSVAMWYYFFCSRTLSLSKPLKWSATLEGKQFLMSAQWAQEVKCGSKLYQGQAALPIYSMMRAFCKELLHGTFTSLLLPSPNPSLGDSTLDTFKSILSVAKDADVALLSCHGKNKLLGTGACDTGFAVIQWWSSVGIVACYWSAGKNSKAETYYPSVEGFPGDSTSVPVALQLAFKANKLHHQPNKKTKTPISVLLQLCSTTSDALKMCMSEIMQDQCTSTENELHKLGLLLVCDWLLDLRVRLWETNGKDTAVVKDISSAFHQDLTTLSQLVTVLPSALPRLRLYRGCYQLIAGGNPLQAQSMLSATGRSSLLRKRKQGKDSVSAENPALCSHEHAMATLLAYKHLPTSLQFPGSSGGDMLPGSGCGKGQSPSTGNPKKKSSARRQKHTQV